MQAHIDNQEAILLETTVIHTTENLGGKEYPITITRQTGAQEILVNGEPVQIISLTIVERPSGTTRSYTRAVQGPTAEEQACVRRRVQEVLAQAILDQGL